MLKQFECSGASRLHLVWECIVRTAKDVFAFFHQSQVDGLSFASIQIDFTLQQFLAVITDSYLQVRHVDAAKCVINFRAIFHGQLAIHGSHPLTTLHQYHMPMLMVCLVSHIELAPRIRIP